MEDTRGGVRSMDVRRRMRSCRKDSIRLSLPRAVDDDPILHLESMKFVLCVKHS